MAQGIPVVITGVPYTIFFVVMYVTIAVTKTSQEDHFTENQPKKLTYNYSYSTSFHNFKHDRFLHYTAKRRDKMT